MSGGYLVGFVVHKCNNLPKADTIGKIDAFIEVEYDGKDLGKTKVIQKNFDPKWNHAFHTKTSKLDGSFKLKLLDKDTVGEEKVGSITIFPPHNHGYQLSRMWDLNKGFKPHREGAPSNIIYSIGWIKDFENLRDSLKSNPDVVQHADKKRLIVPIGHVMGKGADKNDVLLVISFEKTEVELRIWETTDKYLGTKLIEFTYINHNVKYRLKKKTWDVKQSVDGYQIWSELKMDDIPVYFDFNKVALLVSDVTVQSSFTGGDVYRSHGWDKPHDYASASKELKNVVTNDKHKTIAMLEESGVFVVDFNKKDIDFMWAIYDDHSTDGIVADMFYVKHTKSQEREMRYFAKPKKVAKTKIGMNIRVDGIEAQVVAASDFKITLYKKTQTQNFPILDILPLV